MGEQLVQADAKRRGYLQSRKQRLTRLSSRAAPYPFILPAALLVSAVALFPVGYALFHSLYQTEYLQAPTFVGFANFAEVFSDPLTWKNLVNSFVFVGGSLLLALPLGLGLAVALNGTFPLRTFFRATLLLPWVISQVAAGLVWSWLLNGQYGPVHYVLTLAGLGEVEFLGSPVLAMPTVIVANVWRTFPLAMVLLLAALQSVPDELVEAAKVDGATPWLAFWRITFPMIRPTLLNALILLSLTYFNTVTILFVMTGGGPLSTTDTLALRTFREGFQYWNTGWASALGVFIFVLNLLLTFVYRQFLKSGSS